MSLTASMSTMHFLFEIVFILKAIKSDCKEAYDKQNLTLVVISHGIYEINICVCYEGFFCLTMDKPAMSKHIS